MGKRYLRSIVSDIQTLTASADITPVDLPVNPLSFLVLTINAEVNGAQEVQDDAEQFVHHLGMVTDLSVRHRGENIIQGSLSDIAMMSFLLTGVAPWGREFVYGDNTFTSRSVLIPFSRMCYSHDEGFPATQRGNLRFHMTAGAALGVYDNFQWALEAVELIEDNPAQFLKFTTLTRALAATGRQKIPLPIGNELLGLLLFDPSDEVDATEQYAFGKVKILKDNVEQYVATSNWESNAIDLSLRGQSLAAAFGHSHVQAAADTGAGGAGYRLADRPPIQYGFVDFDPLKDGSYSLETAGAASLDLDIDSDVSSGTVRVLPVELVRVGGGAGAA
jgi:hypothetical protein